MLCCLRVLNMIAEYFGAGKMVSTDPSRTGVLWGLSIECANIDNNNNYNNNDNIDGNSNDNNSKDNNNTGTIIKHDMISLYNKQQ